MRYPIVSDRNEATSSPSYITSTGPEGNVGSDFATLSLYPIASVSTSDFGLKFVVGLAARIWNDSSKSPLGGLTLYLKIYVSSAEMTARIVLHSLGIPSFA